MSQVLEDSHTPRTARPLQEQFIPNDRDLLASLVKVPGLVSLSDRTLSSVMAVRDENYARSFEVAKQTLRGILQQLVGLENSVKHSSALGRLDSSHLSDSIYSVAGRLAELISYDAIRSSIAQYMQGENPVMIMQLADKSRMNGIAQDEQDSDSPKVVKIDATKHNVIPFGRSVDAGLQLTEQAVSRTHGLFLYNAVRGFGLHINENTNPTTVLYQGKELKSSNSRYELTHDGMYVLKIANYLFGVLKEGTSLVFSGRNLQAKRINTS